MIVWLVVGPPLWKICVRQLGWWSQPNISGKIQNSRQPNHHQPRYELYCGNFRWTATWRQRHGIRRQILQARGFGATEPELGGREVALVDPMAPVHPWEITKIHGKPWVYILNMHQIFCMGNLWWSVSWNYYHGISSVLSWKAPEFLYGKLFRLMIRWVVLMKWVNHMGFPWCVFLFRDIFTITMGMIH